MTLFLHLGLLADRLGSYVIPFQVAGGITLAGSFLPFMLLCYKQPAAEGVTNIPQEEKGQKLQDYNSSGENTT